MTPRAELPARLVLFDASCGLCDRGVRWLRERDRDGRLHFAPLEGETAALLRARHPALASDPLGSLAYVERTAGAEAVSRACEAVLRICAELPWPWRLLRHLRRVPRPLRDRAYRLVAHARRRLAARPAACSPDAPSPDRRLLP